MKRISWNELEAASQALKEGKLVCFPTETVFGIACIANDEQAFRRLVEAKRRSPDKPFTLMCSSIGEAVRYAEIDAGTVSVLKDHAPGPITFLLNARKNLPAWLTLGSSVIGVRIPDQPEVLALIEKVGSPLLVPSANLSGEPAVSDSSELNDALTAECEYVIEGRCEGKNASTVLMLSDSKHPSIVREGPISLDQIKASLAKKPLMVYLGSDHGGYLYKEEIKAHLLSRGFLVHDLGTDGLASCDYPVFARKVAESVVANDGTFGVVVCTSGQGVMMTANHVPGARCAMGYDDKATYKSREHNDANIVSFGQSYMELEDVLRRVDEFLSEKFSTSPRHHRRVEMIDF